jgi:FtsH-binding integral membrane protein
MLILFLRCCSPSLMFIPLVGSILTLFGVSFRRHVYPSNLILLGAFTVCESFLIGMVTSYMESRIVLQALILTSGVFIGLTLFTFQSKVGSSSIRSLFKERRLID